VQIESRQGLALRQDERDAGQGDEQRLQRRLYLEHDARAERRHHRRIATELQAVAQALLGMEEDGSSGDVALAAPTGLQEIPRRGHGGAGPEAPLVFTPSTLEIA
jgi:hypothetical protein